MNPFFQSVSTSTSAFTWLSRVFFLLCLPVFTAGASLAQTGAAQEQVAPRPYTQAELDQMLAPVALYPDALLSQVLMAATYPLDVVEASQWSRSHPDHQGRQAVETVEADPRYQWDPSVTSLVAFPQLLRRMEENISWTRRLGEAFVYQQTEVMDCVQRLRLRAMEQGNLRSSEQINVYPQGQIISIESVNPQVIYVPYYNPNFVYGNWWWRSYPPVYWAPWPGYFAVGYNVPYVGSSLIWSSGISIGVNFFFGIFDWRQHRVYIRPDRSPRHDPRRYQPYSSPRLGSVLVWRHHPAPRPAMHPHPSIRHDARPGARPQVQVRPGPSQPRHPSPPAVAPGRPAMQDERSDHNDRSDRRQAGERNEWTNPRQENRERSHLDQPGQTQPQPRPPLQRNFNAAGNADAPSDSRQDMRSVNTGSGDATLPAPRPFMLPASAPRAEESRRANFNANADPAPAMAPESPRNANTAGPGNREIGQAEPVRESQPRIERDAKIEHSDFMQERSRNQRNQANNWNQEQGRGMRMNERGSRR
ncbi:conserved exported protein of unknown function [Sterolibacterium denitrificans]|uniref:DUF3300 domain-containing protein n=1 Tax=Sterolibacterium denitrificans TaxID=157592 RepID=A0A7Z7HSC2_9PROT|nr:DUF3300 domain-containing protein [Sterolibacterium denitrificans]SMB28724.1 conserved exported protein of unknown function [Sterolibacterium denitrificans]